MVEMKVDLERREKLRRLHTATHIINYAAKEVLGNHIWQNGSNLKEEFGTLDITHYDSLSQEELFNIERVANEVVFQNKKVFVEELERTEAEQKYGFTLYQGGAIPMKILRVVTVEDSDVEACGGLHMQTTSGIGLIQIESAQKIQDGVVRLKYVVRDFAFDLLEEKRKTLTQASDVFSTNEQNLVATCEKFFNDWKSQKKEIDQLKDSLKETYISQIESSDKNEFEISSNDMGFMMEVFTKTFGKKGSLRLTSEKFVISTQDFEKQECKKEINKGKFTIYIL